MTSIKLDTFARGLYYALLCFVYALTAAIVTYLFLAIPGLNDFPGIGFEDIIRQQSYKPFITRPLLPLIINSISSTIPQIYHDGAMARILNSKLLGHQYQQLGWDQDLSIEYISMTLLTLCCFIGFAWTTRSHIQLANRKLHRAASDILPIVGLLIIPCMFSAVNYVYDPAVIFLSALSLYFLANRSYPLYFLAFMIAAINKETALLLSLPCLTMHASSTSKRRRIFWFSLLVACWASIRMLILSYYQEYPGSAVQWQFWTNLHHSPRIFSSYAEHYIPAGLLVALVAKNWTLKDYNYRNSILVMAVPLALLWLLFGTLHELRVFYELYSFVIILAAPTCAKMYSHINDHSI